MTAGQGTQDCEKTAALRPRRRLLQRVFQSKIKGGGAAGTTSSNIYVATSPPKATPAAKLPMAKLMLTPSLWSVALVLYHSGVWKTQGLIVLHKQ